MIKRLILLFVILNIVISGCFINGYAETLTNLALGKTVISEVATDKTIYVTDGRKSENSNSRTWYTSGSGNYLTVNLGSKVEFNSLYVYEYTHSRITGYKVEVSDDNSNWTKVSESSETATFTTSTGVSKQLLGKIIFPETTAQYIRFTVTSSTSVYYIQELEVYNDPDADLNSPEAEEPENPSVEEIPNFAYKKNVTVSRETSNKDHTKVTDGNKSVSSTANCWNVLSDDYIIIDLGSKKSFDCVVLYEYSFTRTKGYKIEISENNSDWKTIFQDNDEFLTGYGGTTAATSNAPHYYGKFIFDKTDARYIKITILGIDGTKTAYIEEIEVYNKSNMPAISEKEESTDITLSPPVVFDTIPYEDENFHIYLFIGQSNMNGRGTLLEEDYVVVENAYLLNSEGKWEYAQVYPKPNSKYTEYQGYNRYSSIDNDSNNQTNPALSFARSMRRNLPQNIGFGIISNAKGGTSIEQWQKDYITDDGSKNLYTNTIERTNSAIEKGGVLKGIFWLQGDSCAGKDGYLDKLKLMVDNMRNDLNVDETEVPFIASQFVPSSTALRQRANATIAKISSVVANSDYISNEGTVSIGDDLHFDAESQRLLGCRFAEKAMNKIYNNPITAAQLYNSIYQKTPDDLPSEFSISFFPSKVNENTPLLVKNHFGINQIIYKNYVILVAKIMDMNSKYQLEEYGFAISDDGKEYNLKIKAESKLTSANSFGILFSELIPSKNYCFRPYFVYKDADGNLWNVDGADIISYTVAE